MRVFAYCAKSFEGSTRKAAGVRPHTCPPLFADAFDIRLLDGASLLYLDLHGLPGTAEWLGDDGLVALRADQIKGADLHGAIVFALNCHLADDDSPMLDALLDAGAQYVIGGDGENYGGKASPKWAGLLGLWFRRLLPALGPLDALALAKMRVRLDGYKARLSDFLGKRGRVSHTKAIEDTLGFRAYYRKGVHGNAS